MGDNQPPPAGIRESLRRLTRSGMAVVQNRIELFAVELEEQKGQLVKVLLLAGATIFLANTALLAVSATLVVLAGERARLGVLIALSLIYMLGACWTFMMLRKTLRSAPPAFRDTVSELKKDGNWLDPRN